MAKRRPLRGFLTFAGRDRVDADRIADGLYVGAADSRPIDWNAIGFDAAIVCAAEIAHRHTAFLRETSPGLEVGEVPLHDDASPQLFTSKTWPRANLAAEWVADRLRRGQRVICFCCQGRNRSALVAALAARLCFGHAGAFWLREIRKRRRPKGVRCPASVLANPLFAQALEALRAPGGRKTTHQRR